MNVPPQGIPGGVFEALDNSTERIEDTIAAVIVGNTVISLVLAGGMSAVWGLINSLQVVAHFPLLNVKMPANATIMYDVIFTIATFDLPFVGYATGWFK